MESSEEFASFIGESGKPAPLRCPTDWRHVDFCRIAAAAVVVLLSFGGIVSISPRQDQDETPLVGVSQDLPMTGICDEDHLYVNETRMQDWKAEGVPILSTAVQNAGTQEIHLFFRYPIRKVFQADA